ncbi:hypothetical protein A2767_04315 [Candidatus Roizmanbacteria bacterium RIFCSPHIGHO2_01_FULL_35_10]|uniref:Uncharacterized protein n=1 Tax=Candidatus Roizmanbacteria bacterium RIFCSPLOWO2_01_FULL_35_13 TaxID=1802055 RepID=A0A1F7I8H0_9BACT|nr:MAG: hypothetical protein A2767_04315 [Candidatus Roizmanbacteria bacterium RIFCSPHIGHO2_01_FULL_35_10]OGK39653.1 MAG: hypothetical protein A3A74_07760 [Candidatus Roizmanbacteria bacterium RIFCSPLOWO2_01_FULL_35_13]
MSKGFSLLELLVVIGIIGVLAALSLPNFMAARERARDTQRKSDLVQIQKALEIYKIDHSPPEFVADDNFTFPNTGAKWANENDQSIVYMNKVPGDPSGIPYYYLPDNSTLTYTLAACLENKADTAGQDCSSLSNFSCTSNSCYILSEP